MKKLIIGAAFLSVLLSCNNNADKKKFTVTGELKNAKDQHVYLEELYFSQKPPVILDSGMIKNGQFILSAIASEEGMYRIRTELGNEGFLLVNDNNKINFTADANVNGITNQVYSNAANNSLKTIISFSDSIQKILGSQYNAMERLQKENVSPTDSLYLALTTQFNMLRERLTKYCFQYADTAKSPMVSLFAATMAPVEMTKFELPISKLATRFPSHQGIKEAWGFIKEKAAQQNTQANQQQKTNSGNMAPEITMNDVNGKSFSLSSLRGKYVLVDFWASWCGPCRGENPTVVAAYNQFKNKNFTVLGVSLDEDKADWIRAIADDNLTWQQISDLKKWASPVVAAYGIDGIPYNVLVDPQGKIIASNLRGEELYNKLSAILK